MRPWHPTPHLGLLAALSLLSSAPAHAEVTVYGVNGAAQQALSAFESAGTVTAAGAFWTALPAYNNVQLQAPPIPVPPPPAQFGLTLQQSATGVVNLSNPVQSGFYGFSIEFSVVNQISACAALCRAVGAARLIYGLCSRNQCDVHQSYVPEPHIDCHAALGTRYDTYWRKQSGNSNTCRQSSRW